MGYSITNLEPVLREALAVFELFRKLGFSSEKIFFVIPDNLSVIVELHVEEDVGGVRVGALPAGFDREAAFAKWQEVAEHMSEVPEAQLRVLWQHSEARKSAVQIMTSIRLRGIRLPNEESSLN